MSGNDNMGWQQEWSSHWPLTLAAMIGYSTIGLQSYGLGPFVPHLEAEFHWTRTQVMTGLSVSNLAGVLLNVGVGALVDRFGARPVGLIGIAAKTTAFALLGSATGTLLNWSSLWLLVAVGVVLVQSTVWTSIVASHFDRSRGLAMAVVLCGTSATAIICPSLATFLIQNFGWRIGFIGVGAAWLLCAFPVVFFCFRSAAPSPRMRSSRRRMHKANTGLTFKEGLKTRAFFCLATSFAAFSFYSMTIAANLVPLLIEKEISPLKAGGAVALMGVAGIAGRLCVGFLLDRAPAPLIGMATQLLPVVGCALLLMEKPGAFAVSTAALAFGTAIGAEVDVALYLATRFFGLRAFAAIFGAVISVGALSAAVGPYVAGQLYDAFGDYDLVLMIIMLAMTVGAVAVGLIGQVPLSRRPDDASRRV